MQACKKSTFKRRERELTFILTQKAKKKSQFTPGMQLGGFSSTKACAVCEGRKEKQNWLQAIKMETGRTALRAEKNAKKALWVLARCMLEMHDMQREGNIHGVVACWNGGKECSQKENQGIQQRCISLWLQRGNSLTFLLVLNTHFCSGYNLQSTILHFGVKLILHFKQIGMFIVRDSTGAE